MPGSGNRRTRPRFGKPHPSLVLLLAGVGLLIAVAFRANEAVRSHQATVDQVLDGYARTAVVALARVLDEEFTEVTERFFHRTLHDDAPPDAIRGRAAEAASLLDPLPPAQCDECAPPSQCQAMLVCALPSVPAYAARIRLGAGVDSEAGVRPDGLDLGNLDSAVSSAVRAGGGIRGREGLTAVRQAGRTWVVAHSRQRVGADTFAFVVPVDSSVLATIVDHGLARRELLPEALVQSMTNERLFTVRIGDDPAHPLYGPRPLAAQTYEASLTLPAAHTGLTARVSLRPEIAGQLIIGGLPRSRLPLLLGLMAMAIGLLIVAFGQLRREHALARLRADFVSSVSHELRTPLALQRVFIDMIRMGRIENDKERDWSIENIDRETTRLTHLVENVLQFARAEQGQLRFSPEPVQLGSALRDTLESFELLARPSRCRLVLDVRQDAVVDADRDALRQVVCNLLENAVRYGPEAQTIRVSLDVRDAHATITVDDEGPGVPQSERSRIFDAYHRGANAAEVAVAGSGIGLAVVRATVQQHRGSVEADAAPGGGARFRIRLPARAIHSELT